VGGVVVTAADSSAVDEVEFSTAMVIVVLATVVMATPVEDVGSMASTEVVEIGPTVMAVADEPTGVVFSGVAVDESRTRVIGPATAEVSNEAVAVAVSISGVAGSMIAELTTVVRAAEVDAVVLLRDVVVERRRVVVDGSLLVVRLLDVVLDLRLVVAGLPRRQDLS
jgi:hypothetical protein